jgi:hypothetical protein
LAFWRTVTKFTEWLFKAWWALEEGRTIPEPPPLRPAKEPATEVTPTEEIRAEA